MILQKLIDFLDELAPPRYQADYDNSGLLVGDRNMDISGILLSLDCTEMIVNEAIKKNCNVVVSHHPIIFSGLKSITGKNYIERTVLKAIKNDVAIFAIHTNLDSVHQNGVNTRICERLGLKNTSILAPDNRLSPLDENVGAGMVGELPNPMNTTAFLNYLKDCMQVSCIKHTAIIRDTIKRVAVCGGSGSFLLSHAKRAKADIFITSDYKYHQFFDADGDIIIADIGHYESERFTIDLLFELITDNFSTFAAHCTNHNTNPIQYFY